MTISQNGSTVTDFDNGNPASLTTSYTQAAGSDKILVVIFGSENALTHATVTFDGNALTKLVESAVFGTLLESMWYLIDPPEVTGDIVLTPGDNGDIGLVATSWDNVDQSNPFRASNSATGTSDTPSVAVTSEVGDLVLDGVGHNALGSGTPGAGQIELADFEITGDFQQFASKEDGASPSVTMSWTAAGSSTWTIVAGSLQEAISQPITMMV